jgi:mannosyltransferase OCH1-like enzyme
MIPRLIFRTVPAETTGEVELFWATAAALHPGWETITYRDPIDTALFPLSSPHWPRCTSGAQRAGLIRLEALHAHGGIYLDSDVELYRPLTPLLGATVFAGWEDAKVVPDAVLGAKPGHPIIRRCLEVAIEVLDQGPWASGPGVTTAILPGCDDVLLLPPGSFFPYHYSERHRRHEDHRTPNPWAFGVHHWEGSWLR